MYYRIVALDEYTDAAYERDLLRVSRQRREKALGFYFLPDRKRSVLAYMLLLEGLQKEYGFSEDEELLFELGAYGKPELKGHPKIHFSLSHCASYVLCAIHSAPVGADIEADIKLEEALLQQICSEAEQEKILAAEHPENAFALCWTRKESYGKLLGTGIAEVEHLQTLPSESNDEVVFLSEADPVRKAAFSICVQANAEEHNPHRIREV